MKNIKLLLISIFITLQSAAQSILPDSTASKYAFTVGNVYFEIDPVTSGRISSLKLNNEELLYLNKSGSNNWGSTFWPSPQADWAVNWPPPFELDGDVYTSGVQGNKVFMQSKVNSHSGLQFLKYFMADALDTSVSIHYVMINKTNSTIHVAPWEITRFPAGGLTLFPQRVSGQEITGDLKSFVTDEGNVSWFDYDSSKVPAGVPKFYSDGSEGWLAHVKRNGIIVIKKFTDTAVQLKAPDPENEIELYVTPDKAFQEVEQQGAYTSVSAGDSLAWNVKWFVRQVPKAIRVISKNPALANYVHSVIAGSSLTASLEENKSGISTLVYPNPADHKVNITLPEGATSLFITNSLGQILYAYADLEKGTQLPLDLSDYKAGIYFIKIINNKGSELKSFIVEQK